MTGFEGKNLTMDDRDTIEKLNAGMSMMVPLMQRTDYGTKGNELVEHLIRQINILKEHLEDVKRSIRSE